ncbi:hypothetical protein V1517DRAFT_324787 [Lipomyces orientalis]|uniref:Uncharacterized protein n=1 Tax=Lipomyces orientalis TaxID=1233043 RepID=A0ACC3TLJ2_9ASCO
MSGVDRHTLLSFRKVVGAVEVMHGLDNIGFWVFGEIPNIATQSLHKCKELINDCTGLSPIKYDCCHLTPCVCYFGEYESYQESARSVVHNPDRSPTPHDK